MHRNGQCIINFKHPHSCTLNSRCRTVRLSALNIFDLYWICHGSGQSRAKASRHWWLWPGLQISKAGAVESQAKAAAFRPSRAGTSLHSNHPYCTTSTLGPGKDIPIVVKQSRIEGDVLEFVSQKGGNGIVVTCKVVKEKLTLFSIGNISVLWHAYFSRTAVTLAMMISKILTCQSNELCTTPFYASLQRRLLCRLSIFE